MQLIVDQQYLIDKTIISSDLDFALLQPVIEDVQFLKIKPLLGTKLYNLILLESTPGQTLSPANETLLDEYILPCIVRFVLSDSVMALKYRWVNIGIVTKTSNDSTPIEINDVAKLTDYWKNKAEQYGQAMQDFIKANPIDYPTYFTNAELDEKQPNQNSFNTDIYLPDMFCDGQDRI